MKTLSEYSAEELRIKIGEAVRSLATDNTGTLISVSDKPDREDYTIDIDWNNGNKSRILWIFWATKIVFEEDLK